MPKTRTDLQPREVMIAYTPNDPTTIAGSYKAYDDFFDVMITVFGAQHARRFAGQLSGYDLLCARVPAVLAMLEQSAREIGEVSEAARFAQLRREYPRMPLREQTLKAIEMVITLEVFKQMQARTA
jgi:hypothetical protein